MEFPRFALLVVEVFNFLCFAFILKKIVDSYIPSGPRCRHAIQYKYYPFITLKKKKKIHSQYFYNIFTINHWWLVVINSNLNLTLRLLFYSNNNNQ